VGDGGRAAPRRGTLPAPLTRLFGRDADVDELRRVVDGARLVTLVGAAGCGKTRLAIEVGERSVDRHPGGVWFVDLAAVAEGPAVASAVAAALGVAEQPGRAMDEALADALAEGADPLLVLLDNCEHVVGTVAALVERLVTTCASVRILATSRIPLGLAGEQVWEVLPLPVEPAARLFVDRASLASSRFRSDGSDAAAVEQICEHLDGLPLAVELAAASTRLLTVGQIVDRLARAVTLHPGGRRVAGPRHVTMEGAVDWSLQLLEPAEQRLFERLSVFAGGFDLEAAEAVAGGDGDRGGALAEHDDAVLQGLTTLVDHSLVVAAAVPEGVMRYRLLEPVRQCAAGRLAARDGGDADGVRSRHAGHYLALAGRFDPLGTRGAGPAVSLEHLAPEEGNLLAALRWALTRRSDLALRLCAALGPFWEFGGRVNDGRTWCEEALAVTTDAPDAPDATDGAEGVPRVRALAWAARLACRQADYEQARALDEESLDLARRLGDTTGRAAAHCSLGLIAFSRGDVEAVERHCPEGIALARSVGDEAIALAALVVWGWARFAAGDLPSGEEKLREALSANRGLGNPTITAQAHLGLQFGALVGGDAPAQRTHLTAALTAMEAGGTIEPSDWLGCCSTLALAEGRSRAALRLHGAAAASNRQRGTEHPNGALAVTAEQFARVRRELGRAVGDRLEAEGARMSWDELVAEALSQAPDDEDHPLTPREIEVVGLVAEGLTNADIALKLYISRRTVEVHLDHIRRKLNLRNRQEVALWALRISPHART
jgi:predicted ATPase/DNA-binding CsgD family transcriptional regulator